jgi:hypothetical protein
VVDARRRIPGPLEKNKPDYLHPAYEDCVPELTIVRDVDGGYLAMKDKSTDYLPAHPRERGEDYQVRLARPAFFNAFTRTHSGLTGMVFRVDPVFGEDVPPQVQDMWENLDNQGTHGDVFVKEVFDDAMVAGHSFILVDYPQVENADELRRRDEMEAGLRPYWLHVKKDNVRNWWPVVVNGQVKLDWVVIYEMVDNPDGLFGHEHLDQWRVLRRNDGDGVTYELWRDFDGEIEIYQEPQVIKPLTEIPLIPIYVNRSAFMESRPPLIDLAHSNVLHYQTSSDLYHAAHIANVPLLFMKGFDVDEVEVGPQSSLAIPHGGPEVDAKWLETSGNGLGLTREILQDIEGQMAVLGLNMLKRESRLAETAEAKRLDKAEQDSALGSAALNLQDAIENALRVTAEFLKLPEGGSIAVNREFLPEPMSPQQIAEMRNLVAGGHLSLETMWSILEEGGVLPDDFDAELEKEQIDAAAVPMPFTGATSFDELDKRTRADEEDEELEP